MKSLIAFIISIGIFWSSEYQIWPSLPLLSKISRLLKIIRFFEVAFREIFSLLVISETLKGIEFESILIILRRLELLSALNI